MWSSEGKFRGDSGYTALIVGAIAVAVGGTALFGLVAHTWTPFLPQRGGAAAGPFDTVAVSAPAGPSKSAELIPKRPWPKWVPFVPRNDEFVTVELAPAATPPAEVLPPQSAVAAAPPESLSHRESVVLLEAEPAVTPPVKEARVETQVAEPVEPKRVVETKVGKLTVAAAKVPVAAPLPRKAVEPARVEVKVAKAKPVEPRRGVTKVAEAKRTEPKRIEFRPVAWRVAAVGPAEPRAQAKRTETKPIEAKPVEAKRAEPKRMAERKAVEARFAETKRLAEAKAAEAKVAEAKAAEAKATETKLAETRRAAEMMAAKLAETKHAAEVAALEARLAGAQRAIEMNAAEAKLAATEAKLAETKRALAESTPALTRAVETRSRPQYATRDAFCQTCGSVTSVKRYLDRGTNSWEVAVNLDGGNERVFFYSTDPGFNYGNRVRVEGGRLARLYPNRTPTF